MLIQKIVDFILDLFGINTKHEENKDKNINNKVNNYIKRNFLEVMRKLEQSCFNFLSITIMMDECLFMKLKIKEK